MKKETRQVVVYLAAPLFSNAERRWNERIRDRIQKDKRFRVILPQLECKGKSTKQIPSICERGVLESDIILAILDGPDADSGVSYEVGLGKGAGKCLIGVRTDFRLCEVKHVNLMLHYGVHCMIEDYSDDDEALFRKIMQALTGAANKLFPGDGNRFDERNRTITGLCRIAQ